MPSFKCFEQLIDCSDLNVDLGPLTLPASSGKESRSAPCSLGSGQVFEDSCAPFVGNPPLDTLPRPLDPILLAIGLWSFVDLHHGLTTPTEVAQSEVN